MFKTLYKEERRFIYEYIIEKSKDCRMSRICCLVATSTNTCEPSTAAEIQTKVHSPSKP